MFKTILFIITIFALPSFGLNLACKTPEEQPGLKGHTYWVLLNGGLLNSNSGVLLHSADDTPFAFDMLQGAVRISVDANVAHLVFENNVPVDWTNVDPQEKCYQVNGTTHYLRLSESGKIFEGEMSFSPNIKVHPKRPDCPTPDFMVRPPVKLQCQPMGGPAPAK